DIKVRVAQEKKNVAQYHGQLGGYTGEAADVGGGVTAENVKNIAERFYQVVVRSDVGIVDVAWALKQKETDQNSRLVRHKKQEFDRKRRETIARYDEKIKVIEAAEKQRRLEAIAELERFYAKYPNDKRWTPDVMFRLAELYFERSNDEYLAAIDAAQKAAEAA